MWAHGRTEVEWVASARYAVDEFYVKRRIQLDELIQQDDVQGGTVVLHAGPATA